MEAIQRIVFRIVEFASATRVLPRNYEGFPEGKTYCHRKSQRGIEMMRSVSPLGVSVGLNDFQQVHVRVYGQEGDLSGSVYRVVTGKPNQVEHDEWRDDGDIPLVPSDEITVGASKAAGRRTG